MNREDNMGKTEPSSPRIDGRAAQDAEGIEGAPCGLASQQPTEKLEGGVVAGAAASEDAAGQDAFAAADATEKLDAEAACVGASASDAGDTCVMPDARIAPGAPAPEQQGAPSRRLPARIVAIAAAAVCAIAVFCAVAAVQPGALFKTVEDAPGAASIAPAAADSADAEGGADDSGEGVDSDSDSASESESGDEDASASEESSEAAEDASDVASGVSDAGDSSGGGSASSSGGYSSQDGPSSQDSSSASSSPSSSSESAAAPAPAPEPAAITVSVYVDSSRAASEGWPACMASTSVTLSQGATVYDALAATGVAIGGSSSYVSSINGLAEFALGKMSGWKYSVNGVFPNYGCGSYVLSGGEAIRWVYVTDTSQT